MTSNEALKELNVCIGKCVYIGCGAEAMHEAIIALNEIQQYRSIGTVEECREARERQRAKKPVKDEYNHDCCPNCDWIVYKGEWGGRYLPHCENCGQAISWERNDE